MHRLTKADCMPVTDMRPPGAGAYILGRTAPAPMDGSPGSAKEP